MQYDVVCGMQLNDRTALKSIYQEQELSFCSLACKLQFDRAPTTYLGRATPQSASQRIQPRWLRWWSLTFVLVPLSIILMSLGFFASMGSAHVRDSLALVFTLGIGLFGSTGSALGQYALLTPRRGRRFLIAWISISMGTSAVGALLGLIGATFLMNSFWQVWNATGLSIGGSLIFWLTWSAMIGGSIGLGQWFLLRSLLPRAFWWVLMTIVVWVWWAAICYGISCSTAAWNC